MKSSSFFKGLSWLIVLNLLVKPVWIFFIDRQVQNTVGHEEYGRYFAILNLSFVLFFLADAGLSYMLNQRLASGSHVNLVQLISLKVFCLISYIIACFFAAWLSDVSRWELVIYVVGVQVLTSLFLFTRSIVTANQQFSTDAWLSVLDKLLMTVLCGAILYTSFFGQMNLLIFLQIQLVCTATAILVAWALLVKQKLITRGEKESVKNIIGRTIPFAVIILLMGFHNRVDAFLLERIHINGAYEAGVYASAYRLLDASNMAGYLAGSFLIAFIARHRAASSTVQPVLIATRHGLMLLAIGIVSFTLVFAPWVQQLLYHSADSYISLILKLTLASLPAYYLIHVYGALLTALEHFKVWIMILILSSIINLILNVILIPHYGAKGCCIAALASQYICAAAVTGAAGKLGRIRLAGKSFLFYLLAGAVLMAMFYLGRLALINVWIILAAVSFIILLLLTTRFKGLKKYFISLR